MKNHIVVKSVNGSECIVFTDQIISVVQSMDTEGCFIYFANEKAAIATVDTYKEVLKQLGVLNSSKINKG